MGPRAGLDDCGKSRPLPIFDPRTVQPVAGQDLAPTGFRSPDRPARSGTMYNTKSQLILFQERCDFLAQ